jgi:AraC-like DNA-binding protein
MALAPLTTTPGRIAAYNRQDGAAAQALGADAVRCRSCERGTTIRPGVSIETIHYGSPAGAFVSYRWRPESLQGLVRLWYSAGDGPLPNERVFPAGGCVLAVALGPPHRLIDGTGIELLRSSYAGLQTRPVILGHPDRHRVIGIDLHPLAAYALLGMPMRETSDLTVEMSDVLGRATAELEDLCHEAPSGEDCLRRACAWLVQRLRRARGVEEAIAWAVRRIDDTGGAVAIAELRDRTGLSKTRLTGAFRDQIGLAPKLYARIVRFRRALQMLDAGASSLADVAVSCGYYDQPHMNADFRELGGVTPREFVAARYPGGTTAVDL